MQSHFETLVISYAKELIRQDEVERALLVLDNVPAYYRDNPTIEMKELRKEILSAVCTPSIYLEDQRDSAVNEDTAISVIQALLRGLLMVREVERFNNNGVTPHIVDMGPGDYFLPIGLSKLNRKFTYHPLAMNHEAKELSRKYISNHLDVSKNDNPKIFVANEVIEHLSNPKEIASNCYAFCNGAPEIIHLSTPLYTFDSNEKDWNMRGGLPHLRAYTPNEFHKEVISMFQGYNWQLYHGPCMSLRGIREDIEDKTPLLNDKDYGTK